MPWHLIKNYMKLTLTDRIAIVHGAMLPQSSAVAKMITAKGIKSKVDFSQDEIVELNLIVQPANGAVSYRTSKPVDSYSMDVEFSDEEISLLNEGAKRIDEAQQCTLDMLDTVIKFMAV